MMKLCVLAIVIAVSNCQLPNAAPALDHLGVREPHHLDYLHRSRLYYNNRGRIPPPVYGDETPKPYSFSYDAVDEDGIGSSSRREVADATGRVEGSYTLTNDEGHRRVVQYVADEAGFRANIQTNEPGTDNQNPADVVIESLAPSHIRYGGGYPVRPVEVVNDIATESPELPPVPPRPTQVPWYQRIPTYGGRYSPRYGAPYYRRT